MHAPMTPQQQQLFDNLSGFVICKDLHSTYLYTNQREAKLIGLQQQEEAIGMTDFDLPCGAAESAHLFRAQDREVMRSGQSLRLLEIQRYSGNKWRTFVAYKTPLCDQAQNIVGVIGQAQELDSRELLELGALLGKIAYRPKECTGLFTSTSYTIGHHPAHGPKLTQRQEEILFLLLRGKSARLIGRALGIATRTVEWHLCLIKERFAVTSKSELIDKAFELGYLHNIPPGLYKQSLSITLREE